MQNSLESKIYGLIKTYYSDPGSRSKVLSYLMRHLKEEVESQCKLQKVTLTRREKDSETVCAILSAFEECNASVTMYEGRPVDDFEEAFRYYLAKGVKGFSMSKRNHVDVTTVSIPDPNDNPEDLYATKEQIELIKDFIKAKEGQLTLEMFFMYYMDGTPMVEISDLYGVSDRAISERLARVFDQVQRYMKRINNE